MDYAVDNLSKPLIQTHSNLGLEDESVNDFIHRLFIEAIEGQFSDIHIEPFQHYTRIRFRRDSLLFEAPKIYCPFANRVTFRLKILANLNIAEKRLPQDGRLEWPNEYKVDIRINICPTRFGEKIALRFLNNDFQLEIDALGMSDAQRHLFLSYLHLPQGFIILAGPTGCGKTSTLYSALHYLNHIEKNIFTVEDPVEIELDGINQVSAHSGIGLDFSIILRAILRQDPDIIMIGEIRDTETAKVALQAANTGHLVLSSLHAKNALHALNRLRALDIPDYFFNELVSLIVSQRLLRRLCDACKEACSLHYKNKTYSVFKAVGCKACNQGYKGRIGIFEILAFSKLIPTLIPEGINLWTGGFDKMLAGLTSYAEIERVLGPPLT